MIMTRVANGILTRTLCVNDVDLGATWSSYKGSMGHGAQGGTTHGHARPGFLCSKLGGRYGPQVWGGQAIEGGVPIHMSVHEVTFA